MAGIHEEIDDIRNVGLTELNGRNNKFTHLLLEQFGRRLAVQTTGALQIFRLVHIRSRGRAPALAHFGHHALHTSGALICGQLEFFLFNFTQIAHGTLVVGIAFQNNFEQLHRTIVILQHVPLARFAIQLRNGLLLFEGCGLIRRRLGNQGRRFKFFKPFAQRLSAPVIRGIAQGGIHQLAGIRQTALLLDNIPGLKILGFRQSPGNLSAQRIVLRAIGQGIQRAGKGGLRLYEGAFTQRLESGLRRLHSLGFRVLTADFFLLSGFFRQFFHFSGRKLFLLGLRGWSSHGTKVGRFKTIIFKRRLRVVFRQPHILKACRVLDINGGRFHFFRAKQIAHEIGFFSSHGGCFFDRLLCQ